ncbi:uncharacterized protein LAESUDRAFT_757212 [Laetiporus sulphureus 93-53]|uniref:Uncharacterized protein n=1 Tax=Laetiporus sulphureus 93-53 TaxID=1314785 RepID=A0A165FIZ6_9APHY|nr:uncharacterized protein LAESUDRAFT_757212 [Laetiporus sulphureus 93-53]KZT09043.1 hypothetical protein LAESUDRAFT_757212 [Laetiporus sulphureus 93-53]
MPPPQTAVDDIATVIAALYNNLKIQLTALETCTSSSAAVHSPFALAEELSKNLVIKCLSITQPPCSTHQPELIDDAHSSVALEFEDPDGSALATLLHTSLFTFGAPVTMLH